MSIFTTNTTATPFQPQKINKPQNHHKLTHPSFPQIKASLSSSENASTSRRNILWNILCATSTTLVLNATPLALAEAEHQNWGTRSFLKERFFEPGISAEDAVARIKQTAEGLHGIREMLETMSWRYVLFYIRLKAAYLSQDLKNAMTTLPEARRKEYVKTANELVDNMSRFDSYVRSPKVYESYLYYEKTLKSIDDLVALLA